MQSRGRVINTRMALATAQKGSSTIADFFGKVKGLANDMAAAGKKLEDKEVASYILAGLDGTYDPVVSTISGRTAAEPLTLGELYTQLMSWEQRMDLLGGGSGSSANSATRGGHWLQAWRRRPRWSKWLWAQQQWWQSSLEQC